MRFFFGKKGLPTSLPKLFFFKRIKTPIKIKLSKIYIWKVQLSQNFFPVHTIVKTKSNSHDLIISKFKTFFIMLSCKILIEYKTRIINLGNS